MDRRERERRGWCSGLTDELQGRLPPGTRVEVHTTTAGGRWLRRGLVALLVATGLVALVNMENRAPRLVAEGCPGAGAERLWANEEDAFPSGCKTVRRW